VAIWNACSVTRALATQGGDLGDDLLRAFAAKVKKEALVRRKRCGNLRVSFAQPGAGTGAIAGSELLERRGEHFKSGACACSSADVRRAFARRSPAREVLFRGVREPRRRRRCAHHQSPILHERRSVAPQHDFVCDRLRRGLPGVPHVRACES